MMQHSLSIQARFRPEVVELILRVVRHRGFELCALNMTPCTEARSYKYSLDRCQQAVRGLIVCTIEQTNGCRLCRDPAINITTNTLKPGKERKNDNEES